MSLTAAWRRSGNAAAAARLARPIAASATSASVPVSAAAHSSLVSLSVAPTAATPSLSYSSFPRRSFHHSSFRFALFEPSPEKMAKAQEKSYAEAWQQFIHILGRPQFTFNEYEEVCKLMSGKAGEKAGFFQRAKAGVAEKMREWQRKADGKPAPEQEEEIKSILKMIEQFTPEEKTNIKLIDTGVKERVAAACNCHIGDVTLLLARLDQMSSMSEWYRWRMTQEHLQDEMPTNFNHLRDLMAEDRRNGEKYPRMDKMEARARSIMRRRMRNK